MLATPRWSVPLSWTYRWLRWFHAAASCIMVATPSVEAALRARGFDNIGRWSRGVDTRLFRPRGKAFLGYPRPISLYVGRVAVEKGVEDPRVSLSQLATGRIAGMTTKMPHRPKTTLGIVIQASDGAGGR